MTKANLVEPPKLATWLLEQFSLLLDAPLAGDLIESFRQGRSSAWYWRQVLWAVMVRFLQSLRKQPVRLSYAVVCGCLISATWSSMFHVTTRVYVRSAEFVDGRVRLYWERTVESTTLASVYGVYAKSYGIQWPWSQLYQVAFYFVFQAMIVTLALGAYLGFARILKAQNFLRALVVVVVILVGATVPATLLGIPTGDFQSLLLLRQPVVWALIWGPTIMALLIGMWMADSGSTGRPVSA
jgi:hypothetical protein